jgi:hypothetical protein
MKRWEGATEPHNITKLQNKGEFRVKGTLLLLFLIIIIINKSISSSVRQPTHISQLPMFRLAKTSFTMQTLLCNIPTYTMEVGIPFITV